MPANHSPEAPQSAPTPSIHAPRAGCDESSTNSVLHFRVSIHAPHVGFDRAMSIAVSTSLWFQFTHPVWGATLASRSALIRAYVSIHAPRVGCDKPSRVPPCIANRFNSRTPCGVRPLAGCNDLRSRLFQFTHPVWGATGQAPRDDRDRTVSIHAPRAGCD